MNAQLHAFASSERRNDISQQMRVIARALPPLEIDEAAAVLRLTAARDPEGSD